MPLTAIPKTLRASLHIKWDRVQWMVADSAKRSMSRIEVDIIAAGLLNEFTIVQGSPHDVMRVIGVLADQGEGVLISVEAV